jgi:uncharacterized protein YdaU (DUF1376 family)
MNYFEFYPGDYSRDTRHCSLAEHGAFLLLLSAYYATEKPLPADYVALYRMCSAMTPGEQAAVRSVADTFFPVADDGLRHNKRADAEIPKAQSRIEKARTNGKAGGRPPKASKKPSENPAGLQNETQQEPSGNPAGLLEETQSEPSGKAPHTPYTREDQERTSADKPPTDIDARLSQVTDEAIEAYNRLLAEPLALPKALPVGIDRKRGWIRRSLRTIREVCRAAYGSERIEPRFWADYFATQAADDFIAGRTPRGKGHEGWRPDFEYLTRPDVIAKAFERAAA